MTRALTSPETIMNRSNCFKLFAACFHEPEKDLFLEERVHENLGKLLGAVVPSAAESAEVLREVFSGIPQERLSVDYAALFIGPFGLLAPPYGSVYLEKSYQVQGDSTIAVQKCYDENGLSLDIQEPADHIAIELEYMYYLALREAGAASDGDDDEVQRLRQLQAEFFLKCMTWIPAFCVRIRNGAITEYYRALANCLEMFFDHCQAEYSR